VSRTLYVSRTESKAADNVLEVNMCMLFAHVYYVSFYLTQGIWPGVDTYCTAFELLHTFVWRVLEYRVCDVSTSRHTHMYGCTHMYAMIIRYI